MAWDPDDDEAPEGLKKIPTTPFARTSRITGLTAAVGLSRMGSRMAQAFVSEGKARVQEQANQIQNAQRIVQTLSQMKGAAMKLGQMLSVFGDHLFPPEVTKVLASLQAQSHFMAFPEIEKVLISELGEDYKKTLLDFTKQPIASASIGQVHRACLEDGTQVAVKVQYPGVDRSIDSDVDALASLFRVVAKVPGGEDFSGMIDEIKDLLRLETDYAHEATQMESFREYFAKALPGEVTVPAVIRAASTKRVLTTTLSKGLSVQDFMGTAPSQEMRNTVGRRFMHVFNHELFEMGAMQTDPNFGNYRIEPGAGRLVLLDFGAVKHFPPQWRALYLEMLRTTWRRDWPRHREVSVDLGFLRADDTEEIVLLHRELCENFLEPFRGTGEFDFRATDLPQRMKAMAPRIITTFKFRAPPREILFLNRKMIGTFFFLGAIGARFAPRPFIEKYLD